MSVAIHLGSILDVQADAIVNPANSFLRHGAGLAKVIADACAPKNRPTASPRHCDAVGVSWWKEQGRHPLIPTGGAGWTSAGHLSYRGIVHAVGPIWGGGDFLEKQLLEMAYANACSVAHENKCRSLALPAISCGIFGFPVKQAALRALKGVEFWATPQPDGLEMEITFALFDSEQVDAWRFAADTLAITNPLFAGI